MALTVSTPPTRKTAKRASDGPSGVLVLGALSGFLAGILYLGISIPLVIFTVDVQQNEWGRRTEHATEIVDRALLAGTVLTANDPEELGIDWLVVRTNGKDATPLYALGTSDGATLSDILCNPDSPKDLVKSLRRRWATHCRVTSGHTISAGKALEFSSGRRILYWTFLLSLVVGLVTTAGQAQVLRPLTQMSNALERVARGERGVRLSPVGLRELDALVDSINEAAENVEHRQDTISARIAVVQEMARLVAHEVRNPLQSLELLTSLIAIEEEEDERLAIAASIRQEVQALDQVVLRLLKRGAVGGALDLKRKRQAIAPLVEHVARVKMPGANRKGVRLSLGLVSWEEVMVDAAMLGRSLENLVVNALQAVEANEGEVRISVFERGDSLCIAVDDNGPGVDPSLGNSIFDADVTDKKDGHGLGLALTKAVLIAHGGSIEYTDSPLGGTRFLAKLPRHEEDNSDE